MPTKKCPYCAEEIQEDAIKCRHCESDLVPLSNSPEEPQPTQSDIDKKTITHSKGEYYRIAFYVCLVIGALSLIEFFTRGQVDPEMPLTGIVAALIWEISHSASITRFFDIILDFTFLWFIAAFLLFATSKIIESPPEKNLKGLKIAMILIGIFFVFSVIDKILFWVGVFSGMP